VKFVNGLKHKIDHHWFCYNQIMVIREIKVEDYDKLISFWKENYFIGDMDEFEKFKLFLEKNPSLSVLAEEDGKILGTALGSFDGRRGYLQKLVTTNSFRQKGIGKQLVEEVIKRLRQLGVTYIPISVEEKYVGFYEKCGFKKTNQTPMNIKF
jgi:N-acetylglutamate synthase